MTRFCLIFSVIFLSSITTWGQTPNADSLYRKSQQLLSEKQFVEAARIADQLLTFDPDNVDFLSYRAHLYFWVNDFAQAQSIVIRVLTKDSAHFECFLLLIKILSETGKQEEVLLKTQQGYNQFGHQINELRIYRALALSALKQDHQAIQVLDSVSQESPEHMRAQSIKTQILKKQKNQVSVGYLNISFPDSKNSPWNLYHIEYLRSQGAFTLAARVNAGYLFQTSAFQVELDAYYKINARKYVYSNIGVSNGQSIFPQLRLGGEYFYESPKFSASTGFRYLQFNAPNILMFTGHLGKSYRNYSINYRPFFAHLQSNWYVTHGLNFRRNFETKEAYVQLELQYGAVPYFYFINQTYSQLNTVRTAINARFRIRNNFFAQPVLVYEWEEFVPENFRSRINAQLILARRF